MPLYRVSEVKLSYKTRPNQSPRVQVNTSADCYKVLIDNWDKGELEHKESFKILLLNQANFVLGIYTVAMGGISDIQVDIRVILQAALLANASAIVLAHNHPSGNLRPSCDDSAITGRIKSAANVVNINVHDHIIVCKDRFYSFADMGRL